MSSIIEQNEQSEYLDFLISLEWLEFLIFLGSNNISISDDKISSNYSREFQSSIKKKAKKYIKVNSSLSEHCQVSATYSTYISCIQRDKLNIKVQTLENQFFSWKKEKDDGIRKETDELIEETVKDFFQKQEQIKSYSKRLNALKR